MMDPAQVAVNRFARMQGMAPRAGRRQRGGDLLSDQSCFAHAGDNHVPLATVQMLDGATELGIESLGQPQQRLALELDDLARIAQLLLRRHLPAGVRMPERQ